MALRAVLTTSPLDMITSVVLLVFSMVCFAPLAFFARGAGRRRNVGQHEAP